MPKSHVIEVSEKGMSAAERCDRCGAQAYVEVALSATDLRLCAHHARHHWGYIMSLGVMVADHRPYLAKLEGVQTKEKEPVSVK